MISIVIPLYNKEQSIAQTLDSVLSQEGADFEVVIVDDGSTDHSYTIAKGYAERDTRIRLYQQENGGPSKARNTGVKIAQGDWILFLDADDELLPDALETFSKAITRNIESQFIISSYYLESKGGKKICPIRKKGNIHEPVKALLLGDINIRIGSFICTKSLCIKQPFNEQLQRYEDFECFLRMFKGKGVYATNTPVLINHNDFAQASHAKKDIKEDFLGHLDFKSKSFWEHMLLYSLFLGEREYYGKQCKQLYPHLYHRYDLLLIYKVLGYIRKNRTSTR